MKKNKKELFDKETMEMFEIVNKASEEETERLIQEKKDRKDLISLIAHATGLILIFIILFIALIKVNATNYNKVITECQKKGNSLNYCQNYAK